MWCAPQRYFFVDTVSRLPVGARPPTVKRRRGVSSIARYHYCRASEVSFGHRRSYSSLVALNLRMLKIKRFASQRVVKPPMQWGAEYDDNSAELIKFRTSPTFVARADWGDLFRPHTDNKELRAGAAPAQTTGRACAGGFLYLPPSTCRSRGSSTARRSRRNTINGQSSNKSRDGPSMEIGGKTLPGSCQPPRQDNPRTTHQA